MKLPPFPGSARVSRVPFCVSRKGQSQPSDETSAGTRETRALPGILLSHDAPSLFGERRPLACSSRRLAGNIRSLLDLTLTPLFGEPPKSAGQRPALPGTWTAASFFPLAQATLPPEFKPFASPYDIPFLPLWAVIGLTVLATLIVVALVWWLRKRWKRAHLPPPAPRQAALDSLNALQPHIETNAPSEFTVEVASVLRRFVVGQYGIPATRQTSQEFLQSLASSSAFSESDQALLKSFLDKSDLIEFAKLQATSADNRELWEKARQFVEGGQNQFVQGGKTP